MKTKTKTNELPRPRARNVYFVVHGRPQQRGSKQANVKYNAAGKPISKNGRVLTFVKDDNEKSKTWMGQVRDAAAEAFRGRGDLLRGPIRLTAYFYFKRPSNHFGSGKNAGQLTKSAPAHHQQTPDLSKLLRCLEDALTGVVWLDDRQVCAYASETGKFWTTAGECAEILIEELEE